MQRSRPRGQPHTPSHVVFDGCASFHFSESEQYGPPSLDCTSGGECETTKEANAGEGNGTGNFNARGEGVCTGGHANGNGNG